MESLMVEEKVPLKKKIPTVFMYDLFDEHSFVCYETKDLDSAVSCCDCAYQGTYSCKFIKRFKVCVEEDEDTSAVAGVGKSSERDSETASSGEFQSEALC